MDLYKELASTLDTVVHNGALVNHAFTYEQLFEPNVLGSLEVPQPTRGCAAPRCPTRAFPVHACARAAEPELALSW